MSLDLFQTGTYLRCPGGNIENAAEQKANGVHWAAMNIGSDPCVNHDPSVWATAKSRYAAAGVPIGPWMHCRSMDDVIRVIDVGVLWGADFIGVNVEDVYGDKLSLKEVGGYLLDFWVNKYQKPVHMATLPWVQNSQGWQYVSFCYLALEMFPLEGDGQKYLDGYQACIDHAFAEGAKRVTLLYSTTSPRAVYPPAVAHCLYTADNVTNWPEWKDTVPQLPPEPPKEEVPVATLTAKQFPYTGPLYGPSHSQPVSRNRATVKGLKRALIRLGYLLAPLGQESDDFGPDLEKAFKVWMKEEYGVKWTYYGQGSWEGLRAAKVTEGPNKGQWAMDSLALKYVRDDALLKCYPHPLNAPGTYVGQGLHPTAGVPGNWAIDFMAPGGTKVLAVENAIVTRLSGHPPGDGANQTIGIFGWTIYYETTSGYRYFCTHLGTTKVVIGQHVNCGQVIGTVGKWPGDPGRSHTHLGVSSSLGIAAAKKRITEISQAPRVVA